jgi:hypothetical protein
MKISASPRKNLGRERGNLVWSRDRMLLRAIMSSGSIHPYAVQILRGDGTRRRGRPRRWGRIVQFKFVSAGMRSVPVVETGMLVDCAEGYARYAWGWRWSLGLGKRISTTIAGGGDEKCLVLSR